MLLIDIHCHLDDKQFDKDRDAVILNSQKSGVKMIINNGINRESNAKTLIMTKKYEIMNAALGLYPIDASNMDKEEIDEEISFIEKHKDDIIAIGEVGLDYHLTQEKEMQSYAFKKMIGLSKKIGKPLIIHSRKAEEDCINILEKEEVKKVIMHCFSGNMKLVKRIKEQKWFMSIPANIVFSTHFQTVVKEMPLSQLLTETDSPYLGPFKGVRNEPKNVEKTIEKIAEIKEMDPTEVANIIFQNFQRLFL